MVDENNGFACDGASDAGRLSLARTAAQHEQRGCRGDDGKAGDAENDDATAGFGISLVCAAHG